MRIIKIEHSQNRFICTLAICTFKLKTMLSGAIIGGVTAIFVLFIVYASKNQKFIKIRNSIKDPGVEYAALYHYASYNRYRKSFKFYDSIGALYLIGKTLYYKTSETAASISFNLAECTVQQEPDWRMLKWFSVTTHVGEKYYFNSNKMGFLKSNSDETLKGFNIIKAKATS